MNKTIQEFMNANAMARRLMIRAGFELETQKTEGDDSDSIDYDAAGEAISEQAGNLFDEIPSEVIDCLSDRIQTTIREAIYDSVSDSFDYSDYMTSNIDNIQSDINRAIRKEWKKFVPVEKQEFAPLFANSLPKLDVGTDNSVDGVEIRTIDGLTYRQFYAAAKAAFSLDHDIDTDCSFHIHLSIPNVKHSFGDRFQLALVEYLIENVERLPANVQERFKKAPKNEYINGLLSSQKKYSFVHAHDQGTWEFRCFGNVHNASEAMTCLNIAIEAMNYAYQATKAGMTLLTDKYDGDIAELFRECLTFTMPVSKKLREKRKIFNQRQAA